MQLWDPSSHVIFVQNFHTLSDSFNLLLHPPKITKQKTKKVFYFAFLFLQLTSSTGTNKRNFNFETFSLSWISSITLNYFWRVKTSFELDFDRDRRDWKSLLFWSLKLVFSFRRPHPTSIRSLSSIAFFLPEQILPPPPSSSIHLLTFQLICISKT